MTRLDLMELAATKQALQQELDTMRAERERKPFNDGASLLELVELDLSIARAQRCFTVARRAYDAAIAQVIAPGGGFDPLEVAEED